MKKYKYEREEKRIRNPKKSKTKHKFTVKDIDYINNED